MEALLDRATDPNNRSDNIDQSLRFAAYVKSHSGCSQLALKMICRKIRTWDSVVGHQALNVLETCVERSGPLFVHEIGKNIFLNELVKIVHQKFDGDKCHKSVKLRIICMLRQWSRVYIHLPKINRAHQLLIENGVVPEEEIHDVLSPPEQHAAIGDERSNCRLAELIKLPNFENVREANKIIQTIIRKEDMRVEREVNRLKKITDIRDHATLIFEITRNNNSPIPDELSLLRELYESSVAFLKDLETECGVAADNNDDLLGEMVKTAEMLSSAINCYEEYLQVVKQRGLDCVEDEDPLIHFDVLSKQDGSTSNQPPIQDLFDPLLFSESNTRESGLNNNQNGTTHAPSVGFQRLPNYEPLDKNIIFQPDSTSFAQSNYNDIDDLFRELRK